MTTKPIEDDQSRGSVSRCIEAAKRGDIESWNFIFERYWKPLVNEAEYRLRKCGVSPSAIEGKDDVAHHAFSTFHKGINDKSFEGVTNRGELWGLFRTIIERKAQNVRRYESREKRKADKIANESVLDKPDADGNRITMDSFADEHALMAADLKAEVQEIMDELSPEEQAIIDLLYQGYNRSEILTKLRDLGIVKVSPQKVKRAVEKFQRKWLARNQDEQNV